jgi:ATP-dependent Clp protease ATP-binding subunit ClpC
MSRYDRYEPSTIEVLRGARDIAVAQGDAAVSPEHLVPALLAMAKKEPLAGFFRSNGFMPGSTPAGGQPKTGPSAAPAPNATPAANLKLSDDFRGILDAAESLAGTGRSPVRLRCLVEAAWPVIGRSILEADKTSDAHKELGGWDFSALDVQAASRPTKPPAKQLKFLQELGRELTAAPLGHPIIGRDAEIEQIENALLKYFKPNPLLVGEAGVGKTAVVEGLAERIRCGTCHPDLAGSRIFEIRISDLIAGTVYHGQLEERLKNLISEAEENPDVILFLDEVHMLTQPERISSNPADVFKPALARGKMRVIAATTTAEYRTRIEKDAAIARRFELINLGEPDKAAMEKILCGVSEKLSAHHGVAVSPGLISSAVEMADQFLVSRKFPDKAIDLLDRALTTAKRQGLNELDISRLQRTAQQLAGMEGDDALETRLEGLGDALRRVILGQDHAAEAVARALNLCKKRMDFRPDRPDGVFLFTGPTGVGKSALAAALARQMTGRKDGLFTLSMAEFAEGHSLARLVGSPPGYVGHGQESLLGRAASRNPCGVLLLDEFEKAHPEVHRIFLEIFDTGKCGDACGATLHFHNMTIIATANVFHELAPSMGFGGGPGGISGVDDPVHLKKLQEHFSRELLGRFDEMIFFRPMERETARRILRECIVPAAATRWGKLREAGLTRDEEEAVLDAGFSDQFGVRHLEKAFERLILAPLAAGTTASAVDAPIPSSP